MSLLRTIWAAHAALPTWLKLPVVAFGTVVLMIVGGSVFTLPPGPLCDEGMVLFMEGGCDWGESNIFFFTKVGLLVATAVVALAAGSRVRLDRMGLLPHVFALGAFALVPSFSEPWRCDTYYGHPNGNYAQLIVEQAAFALFVLACLPLLRGRSFAVRSLILLGLNGVFVGAFYLWLAMTPHWTWLHTSLVAGSLCALAAIRTRNEFRSTD